MKHLFSATLLAAGLMAAPVAAQQATSVWDGVYTAEQAERGASVYGPQCSQCHGPAPAIELYDGQPLSELFSFIRTKMPDGNPGSLLPTEYADAMAYLLRESGMPAGEKELGTLSRSMTGILFTMQPPEGHPAAAAAAAPAAAEPAAPAAAAPAAPAEPPPAKHPLEDTTH